MRRSGNPGCIGSIFWVRSTGLTGLAALSPQSPPSALLLVGWPLFAVVGGMHPLEVGGDRVGSLLIESPDPDGPEARQQQVVAQLLPTVALVARAVGLAVEAEHARRDVARERDAERKRSWATSTTGSGLCWPA